MKVTINLLAAGLFLLSSADAQVNPFPGDPLSYGESDPVYPSRECYDIRQVLSYHH